MKYLIVALLFSFNPFLIWAQRATFSNDTLKYKDRHFTVGDTVNVAYGSGQDGRFVFLSMGSGIGGTSALESQFSKSQLKIDKIYKNSSGIFVRSKVLNSNVGVLGGNKVFIQIEGALDKKEID
jgi:hypothetical protein